MSQNPSYPPEYLAEDVGRRLTNVAITFGVLEVFFVGIFFTSRLKSRTANGMDTYLMLPAFIFCFGHVILDLRKSRCHLSCFQFHWSFRKLNSNEDTSYGKLCWRRTPCCSRGPQDHSHLVKDAGSGAVLLLSLGISAKIIYSSSLPANIHDKTLPIRSFFHRWYTYCPMDYSVDLNRHYVHAICLFVGQRDSRGALFRPDPNFYMVQFS
jgi:hypothetical protein